MTENTGPRRRGHRTKEGNVASSRNALKHGLRAKVHMVLDHEDPQAFDAFRADVRLRLEPEGLMEIGLADRIAGCLWRLNRAVLVETAVMDDAFQHTLAAGIDEFTPAERFRRGLIASVNNACLDPTHRYEWDIQRLYRHTIEELRALQAARLFHFPISPGALRITIPAHSLPGFTERSVK